MLDDLYPVTVDLDGRLLRKARLFVRDGQVRIYVDENRAGVVLAAAASVVEISRHPGRRYTLTVDDGATWEVTRTGGCGCGSRLKRLTAREAWS